jgi:PAS domain S-box-containing protein
MPRTKTGGTQAWGLDEHVGAALDRLGDGITIQAPGGEVVYANETGARLCGFDSAEEMVTTPVAEIVGRFELQDEAGRPLPVDALPGRAALRGEVPDELLIRRRRRDTGALSWAVVQAMPVFGEEGEVQFAVNLFRDVTDRMEVARRQRFLAEASELLSSSLDHETILVNLARLCVPTLADWALVWLLDEDGSVRVLTRTHGDPERVRMAEEMSARYQQGVSAQVRAVIETGEPLVIPEVTDDLLVGAARDDTHLGLLRDVGLQSAVVVPLAGRARVHGAVGLMTTVESGRVLDDAEAELVRDVGRRAATAIDHAQLLRSYEQAAARGAIQSEVALALAHGAEEIRTVVKVLEIVCRHLDWDSARLWRAEPGERLRLVESWQRSGTELPAEPPEYALALRESVWAPGTIAFPVVLGGETVGVIELKDGPGGDPGPELRETLYAIGGQVGLFLDRIRVARERTALLASEHAARAEAEIVADSLRKLEQVTQAALAHVARGDLIDEMLLQITLILGADTSAVLLLDDDRKFLRVRATRGFDRELEEAVPIPYGKGMAGRVAASRKPVLIRDLNQVELASPHLRMRGIASLVAIPLLSDGEVIGVAHAGSVQPTHFDENHIRLFELMADRLALAIAQLRLFEAEREARHDAEQAHRRLSFLAEASTILASSLDYESTLEAIARLVVPHIADWCAVHVVDQDAGLRLIALAHGSLDAAELRGLDAALLRAEPGSPVGPAAVLRTGSDELVPDVGGDVLGIFGGDDEGIEALRRLGFASYLCVPMHGRDQVTGTITLASASPERRFDEADLALAEELARRTAVAVENALLYREAEERGRAARVLAAVGDGVFLIDSQGVIRLWNPAAEAISGLPAEDVLNRPATEAIPGWETISPRIPVARELGAPARAETVPVEIRGRELWLSLSGVGFADGIVYAFRDLTQDRALEELKGEFVSTVSHELRTPLAAIYGAAMTLQRPDLPEETQTNVKLIDVIVRESERLASIVNDILGASRLDSNAVEVSIQSFDAAELAAGVVESAAVHLPEGIEVTLVAPPELPLVAGDQEKTRQVLGNLVDNAVKYSPGGGPVEVELSAGDTTLRFAVHDRGLGVPPAEQRRIFEKFYRLDPNMTRGVGGTGLGLYICRELVHRMNGRIWVVSPRAGGKGSSFVFELPLA